MKLFSIRIVLALLEGVFCKNRSEARSVIAGLALVRRPVSVATFACWVAMLCANVGVASVSYTTVGGSYTQDFNSLPVPTTGTGGTTNANIETATNGGFTNGWKDDDVTIAGTQVSLAGWYLYHDTEPTATPPALPENGTNNHQRLRFGNGSQNTGAFWNYGTAGSSDRSLGNLTSSTIDTSYYGVRLTNNSGVTLNQFTLQYAGEQWRDANTTQQAVTFSYAVTDATPTNIGVFNATSNTGGILGANIINAPTLNFSSTQNSNSGTSGIDGNSIRQNVSATIKGLFWAPGQDLWLRWTDIDHAGNDQGLSVDDLSFSANVLPASVWTGAVNSDWNNTGNWLSGLVPDSGDIATFDGPGNGNTTISLGGTRPIGYIRFNSAAVAAYTLGSSAEQFDIDDGGSITVAGDVATLQTIAAKLNALGALTIANSSTNAGAGLTIGSDVTSSSSLVVDNAGVLTFNGAVSNNGSLTVNGAGTTNFTGLISGTGTLTIASSGTIALNAQNTHAATIISVPTAVQPVIRVGASTVGSPGSVTAGPFGTGTLTLSGATSPIFQPTGSDITIANNITANVGFFAGSIAEPSANSLTLSGNISNVGSRTITSNVTGPAQLNLGATGSTGTLTRTGTNSLTLQSQLAAGSTIVINHQLSGGGLTTVQNGAIVHMNGIDNNYTGITNISGTNNPKLFVNGTKTGTGAVNVNVGTGSVGTLGGTGSIAGAITNNGIIAPGLPGGAPATLTATDSVTNGANGRWAIELSGASADKLAVGGNIDLSAADFLDITGAGTGSSWVIATYGGTLTGTFDNVTPGYTVDYGLGSNSQITLNAAAAGLLGDFNSDGKVDAGDYVTWRKNEGTNNALANDNGLGTPIRPEHYDLWRANFGNPPGSGSGLDGSNVPEPGTIALLGTALIALACPRRRCYSSARFLD